MASWLVRFVSLPLLLIVERASPPNASLWQPPLPPLTGVAAAMVALPVGELLSAAARAWVAEPFTPFHAAGPGGSLAKAAVPQD